MQQLDGRSQAHATKRGYDLIRVMDHDSLRAVLDRCLSTHRNKVQRLTTCCPRHCSPGVPDPYCGGGQGFEQVLDLIKDACDGGLKSVIGCSPV